MYRRTGDELIESANDQNEVRQLGELGHVGEAESEERLYRFPNNLRPRPIWMIQMNML
jgi:hypothetical protein